MACLNLYVICYITVMYIFNRQDFVSDVKMRNSWFFELICYIQPQLYNKMAVRFGLIHRRISTFHTKSSFSMYKWHVSTYMPYVISQQCMVFNRQDFVSDVKMRNSWFLSRFAIFSRDCTTKWWFVLVWYTDIYQLFTQNLASPCTNDMSQLICHTLYHSDVYFLIGRIS